MFDLLLYSTIHCVDAVDLINRIDANKSVDAIIRTEVIETVKEATPECLSLIHISEPTRPY